MILKFPDLDMLRLALTSGASPASLTQTAAVAGFDDQNQVWIETPAALSRASQTDLRRLGVQLCKTNGATNSIPVACWPEILPLRPEADPIDRLEQTPILFEVADQDSLGRLVVEILRLGNDRQGFRWLEKTPDADEGRGLLRVVGPPYYTLLRAIDRNGQAAAPRAYRERAPRVWVEVGWKHQLADHLKPPVGKLLLAASPRQWTLLDDGPFRDVYDVMEFALPTRRSDWKEGALKAKVRPTLRLTPGGSADGAELWVLHDDPVAELNRFVQNSDDQMLHRLAFAVGEKDGRSVIVLRTRPSRLPPPELVLRARPYKTYLKLSNLFLPVGVALHPPLRRDMVRKLLAEDPAQVTWLTPLGGGAFRPETLPEDAFRPLIDWIDYILDHEAEPLQAWIQAAQFDFEAFICDEDLARRKKPHGPPDRPRDKKKDADDDESSTPSGPAVDFVDKSRRGHDENPTDDDAFTVEKVEPSVLQQQLRALEARFTALEGGLDLPERQALWPPLANLNGALGDHAEAGLCWLNALWGREEVSEEWAWNWFGAEAADVPVRPESGRRNDSWASRLATAAGKGREIADAELNRLLALREPASADLPRPGRLPRVDRAARLASSSNPETSQCHARIPGNARKAAARAGDVVGLGAFSAVVQRRRAGPGSVRDRLLERLFQNGLRPEQDLPGFLRFAGHATNQRFRGVGVWLRGMAERAREWIDRQGFGMTVQGTGGARKSTAI